MIILADDMGYSDVGAFGGEIPTPNIDALASRGVRLTNFYTASVCSPTRAMLLTGQDPHAVGLGGMLEMMRSLYPELIGRPGYEGELNSDAPTIAEHLEKAGYSTMMSGKWHLGRKPEAWPSARGFKRSFALLGGGGSHFGVDQDDKNAPLGGATYLENGRPAQFPTGSYAGDVFTEKLIGYLQETAQDSQPFFAYLALTQPHWPLQAPQELIEKHKGRYAGGPALLRAERLERMRQLGLIDGSVSEKELSPLSQWADLNDAEQAISARAMEIYAAMVESLDQNVGEVITALESLGKLDNTVILFMSDNGADARNQEQVERLLGMIGMSEEVLDQFKGKSRDLEHMGTAESYVAYGPEWASAVMAPSRMTKGSTYDGGIKAPAIVAGPGIREGVIANDLTSAQDVMVTLLDFTEAVEVTESDTAVDREFKVPTGKSWRPMLTTEGSAVRDSDDMLAWELYYRKGVRIGPWKAVYSAIKNSVGHDGEPMEWRLYNLDSSLSEMDDLSQEHPEILEQLIRAWHAYAEANQVATRE